MKKISTGIAVEYVKKWTSEEAIREILQNYLDSCNEFDCRGTIKWENGIAKVTDYGPGLQMKHLALGISDKNEAAIGKFGKGLKQALLVLAREDRNVAIISGGKKIMPTIEHCDNYETDILFLSITKPTGHETKVTGTQITFACSEDELVSAKSYFLAFIKGDYKRIDKKLLRPGGDIFVNGSKVGKVAKAMFSYDLTYAEAKDAMSSDRDMINQDKLRGVLNTLISTTNSIQAIRAIMHALRWGTTPFEITNDISVWNMTGAQRARWRRAFIKEFGDKAVLISSDEERNLLEYYGYEPVELSFEWRYNFQQLGLPTAKSILEKAGKANVANLIATDLTDVEKKNLKTAIAIVKEVYPDLWVVHPATDLKRFMGITNDRKDVAGVCSHEKSLILIDRNKLVDLPVTVNIIFHEAVHQNSGASDITEQFQNALGDGAARALVGMWLKSNTEA